VFVGRGEYLQQERKNLTSVIFPSFLPSFLPCKPASKTSNAQTQKEEESKNQRIKVKIKGNQFLKKKKKYQMKKNEKRVFVCVSPIPHAL
jgi:hypothetical protein